MIDSEIILAAHFRNCAGSTADQFQNALTELRSGQDLTCWVPKTLQQSWKAQLHKQLLYGVRFIYPGHDFYPSSLLRMYDPPILLSYLGSPVWMSQQGLSVVGSRNPKIESLNWLEQTLPALLQENNIYVVSGGARGIDQMAHSLCLRYEAPTVAMVPSGLGQIYPQELIGWVRDITAFGGAIVSEYPFQKPMRKNHFQARNRLIAGFSIATLIIEASVRSGTMITARQCAEQGRPLFVVPSHPLEINSRGGLDLICDGATPVRDAEDLRLFYHSEIH
jgi:DNA processing protein